MYSVSGFTTLPSTTVQGVCYWLASAVLRTKTFYCSTVIVGIVLCNSRDALTGTERTEPNRACWFSLLLCQIDSLAWQDSQKHRPRAYIFVCLPGVQSNARVVDYVRGKFHEMLFLLNLIQDVFQGGTPLL